jgi:hypothetical protein
MSTYHAVACICRLPDSTCSCSSPFLLSLSLLRTSFSCALCLVTHLYWSRQRSRCVGSLAPATFGNRIRRSQPWNKSR